MTFTNVFTYVQVFIARDSGREKRKKNLSIQLKLLRNRAICFVLSCTSGTIFTRLAVKISQSFRQIQRLLSSLTSFKGLKIY